MGHSYSQDFISTAEQEPRLDEHGNVLNNITDKNGLRQGDWFYLNINGVRLAKKVYSDNNCQDTYISINKEWINTRNLSANSDFDKDVIKELKMNGFELNNNRQVLIILDNSGNFLSGDLLGNWMKEDDSKVSDILKAHFSKLNIKSSRKIYILL